MEKINDKFRQAPKIKRNYNIYAVKIKTESNSLGALKTLIVLLLILIQASILILSYLYFSTLFEWYFVFSMILTVFACVHVLSSDYHGQAKATWTFFLLISLGFGYIIYIMSDKRISFAKSRKKYNKIIQNNEILKKQTDLSSITNPDILNNCNYLYSTGKFVTHTSSKTTYFPSGTSLFDDVLLEIEKAKDFIFIEYFIITNGVLLNRFLEILKKKALEGVDVRIIYDDMGSHGTLKRKTKKEIINSGIKLQPFNRLVPLFNIALNLRNHRKIVIIDGKVSFTGGANLADEYTNEKRMHGYWKDEGIKIEGKATDNFTLSYLEEWEFLTNEKIEYNKYINKEQKEYSTDGVVTPFVSGPNYPYSIARNMFANIISSAKEKLYIMSPYFIPDESLTTLIVNKAKSGVDVRIILPEVADKKFVYIVSRNNAEKMISSGVKIYTMNNSFVHSKVILTDNSAIVGSINLDLRSFNQQFESAVYTNQNQTLNNINADFEFTFSHSKEISCKNMKRNKLSFRITAGFLNIISPFM